MIPLAAGLGFQHTKTSVYLPEFELVLACVRWPPQTVDGAHIRSLAQQTTNWPHLLQILRHHKVVPLFMRNCDAFAAGCIPEETATVLRGESTANIQRCLQRMSHLADLHRLFREQHVDLRIFKGIPLAITAFHDPTLRDDGDIDLLIAEKDILKAGEILHTQGYVRVEPAACLTPRRLRSYMAHQKDFSYEHPSTGMVIDLHWRLYRNSFLPSNARLEQVGETSIDIGSERIATFPPPRMLLYLCVHGALDGWLRLKWLADIGALLHSMTAEQLTATAALAAEQQALPQFTAAILLCLQMLGPHPAPAGLLDGKDPRVAHILRFGTRLLTSNRYRPVRERISSIQWFGNELRMHNSFRYRLDLFLRFLFRPRAWSRFDLPDGLFPLYALLSPLDWLAFRVPARRILERPMADIGLGLEALCMLSFFRLALNFLPVQKLTQWMATPEHTQPSPAPADEAQTLRRVEWSIAAAVRHAPFTFLCFPQCLAAYFMLRRRHIASRLFYGVAREANQLKAHTWVKVGEQTVAGGDAAHFTVLTSFP